MMSAESVTTIAVGVVENRSGEVLIGRAEGSEAWVFPQAKVRAGETPEAAVRRAARELGLRVRIHTVQPPVEAETGGEKKIFRYHFCEGGGQEGDGPFDETRWVLKGQLREYVFTGQDKEVVEWILGE
jgi:ADP-ribose pyrophosphatase YjhB (NUDIX family)